MCSQSEQPVISSAPTVIAQEGASEAPQPLPRPAKRKARGPMASRPRKDILLPEITQLALEGNSSQAIAAQIGVPRRTIDRWLQERRREWNARAAESAAEMFAVTLARLESAYREAMQAWRRSQADKQIRIVADAETNGGDGDPKASSIRTETRSGQAALLGKAIHAALAICKLKGQYPAPPPQTEVDSPAVPPVVEPAVPPIERPLDLADLTVSDLNKLTDMQLFTLEEKFLTLEAKSLNMAVDELYDLKLWAEDEARSSSGTKQEPGDQKTEKTADDETGDDETADGETRNGETRNDERGNDETARTSHPMTWQHVERERAVRAADKTARTNHPN